MNSVTIQLDSQLLELVRKRSKDADGARFVCAELYPFVEHLLRRDVGHFSSPELVHQFTLHYDGLVPSPVL